MILRPGQAAVAHRAADHEPAGRVDQEVARAAALVVEVGRQHRLDDVLPQVGLDLRLAVDAVGVLGRDQELLDRDRPAVAVADGHLGLAVRAQVGHDPVLAHLRQPLGDPVGERDRHRHQLGRLVGRVAEHHALVAGPGQVELVVVGHVGAHLVGAVDALGDVGRLLVDRVHHRARVAVEAVEGVVVADPAHRLAGDLVHVDVARWSRSRRTRRRGPCSRASRTRRGRTDRRPGRRRGRRRRSGRRSCPGDPRSPTRT